MLTSIRFSLDSSKFRARYYEQLPLLMRHALKRSAYSWAHLNRALSQFPINPAALKVFRDGPIPFDQFVRRQIEVGIERYVIDQSRFAALVSSRGTVVLNRFEMSCPIGRDLCNQIARYAGAPAIANAYFSKGGTGALGHHWDRHDVFAVQLIGRKRWRVYKPTVELPMNFQRSSDHREDCPTDPVMDVVLEAGSILYVPRGWWHSADAIGDEQTLHLAVGLHPPLVQEYVEWVTTNYLPTQVEARRTVEMCEGDNCSGVDALETVASLLSKQLVDPANLKRYQEHIQEQQRFTSAPSVQTVLNEDADIGDEASIAVNAFRPIEPKAQVVSINGCQLDLDAATAEFLAGLQRRGRVTMAELCANAPSEVRARTAKLVSTLAAEGVLEVVPPRTAMAEQ